MITRLKQLCNRTVKFLFKHISHIKVFKYPLFITYRMPGYKFKKTHEILDIVKPGDIILRRYNGFLTTFLIPGYFSHGGFAKNNQTIIHSIGEGVVEEDMIQYCRCDDIAVLRIKNIDEEDIKEIVDRAIGFLGVEYDYVFDMETDDKLFCTELISKIVKPKVAIDAGPQSFYGLIKLKDSISPDMIYENVNLEIIYDRSF